MRAWVLVALGVVGCGPLVIPRAVAPEGAYGEILLVGDEREALAAFASDPESPTTFDPTNVAGVERAEVFFVADHIEGRGLTPGAFELGGELVTPLDAEVIDLDDDASWRSGPVLWEERLRLPPVDVTRCLDFDHCFADQICGPCDRLRTPAEPMPPEPPIVECPPGWTLVPDGDFAHCRPFAVVPTEACPPGTGRFPGGDACVGVAAPCPGDGWPADLPPDAVFVSASATAPGDGSRARPFPRLQDAEAAVSAGGGTVALSVGTHSAGIVAWTGTATIVGACRDTTLDSQLDLHGDFAVRSLVLVGSVRSEGTLVVEDVAVVEAGPAPSAIRGSVGELLLSSVSVSAPTAEGIRTNEDVRIVAQRIYVGPGAGEGIIIQGEESQLTDAFVEGRGSFGVQVLFATDAVIRNVGVLRNRDDAVRIDASTGVTIENLSVQDLDRASGVAVVESRNVGIDNAWFVNGSYGDIATSVSQVRLHDLVVVDAGAYDSADRDADPGSLWVRGSSISVERAAFLRPQKNALFPRTSVLSAMDVTVVEHVRAALEVTESDAVLRRARLIAAPATTCAGHEGAGVRSSRGLVRLEDVAIESSASPGVFLDETYATQVMSAERVRIHRAGGCGGEALFLGGGWSTVLTHIDLSAEAGTALMYDALGSIELSTSRIANSMVGIAVSANVDAFRLVDGVRFEDNVRAFVQSASN
ncbi:MAG: right-handed parallel beta-helix repeat-containing protein [Deltaproteobacteria bacterium]